MKFSEPEMDYLKFENEAALPTPTPHRSLISPGKTAEHQGFSGALKVFPPAGAAK